MKLATTSPRGGFTLLEILIAMAILALGVTSVLGLLTFGAALTRTASLRGQSAAAVEAVVANLEERLFPLVDEDGVKQAGEPVDVVDQPIEGFPELTYSARAIGDPSEIAAHGRALQYKVEIEVAWKSRGQRKARTFETLLLREIPFGERLRREFIEGDLAEQPAAPTPPAK